MIYNRYLQKLLKSSFCFLKNLFSFVYSWLKDLGAYRTRPCLAQVFCKEDEVIVVANLRLTREDLISSILYSSNLTI